MTGYRITYTDPAGQRHERICRELAAVMDTLHDLRAAGATRLMVERGKSDLAEADAPETIKQPKGTGWCW